MNVFLLVVNWWEIFRGVDYNWNFGVYGGNSNGTVLADCIYSDFNIANYSISDNHSKENKETLEDIIFDRTNSNAHIHRANDLL